MSSLSKQVAVPLPGSYWPFLVSHVIDFQKYQIEAIPTIIMAFMILLFLPSFPFSAGFLTPRERAIAQARLNRDQKPQSHGGMTGWKGFLAIVSDIHAWMFTVLYASCEYMFPARSRLPD
jgi:hypothetical protein